MRWYIYGVTGSPPPLDAEGVGGQPVSALEEGSLWLIGSPWAGDPPGLEPAAVLAHERVVEVALEVGAVLPFRYGTVVDEVAVRAFVQTHSARIARQLAQVRGRVEVSLKLIELSPPPPREPVSPARPSTGLEYMQRRREAVRRLEERAERARAVVARVEERLAPWIADRRHRLAPDDRVLAAITHLIPREAVGEWTQAVADLRPQLTGLDCLASGPWPPYHFAEVTEDDTKRPEPHSGASR